MSFPDDSPPPPFDTHFIYDADTSRFLYDGVRTDATIASYHVLVPLFDATMTTRLERQPDYRLRTAHALAREHNGELLITGVVRFDDHHNEEGVVQRTHEAVQHVVRQVEQLEPPVAVHGGLCLAHSAANGLLELTEKQGYDAIVAAVREEGPQTQRVLGGEPAETLTLQADCDVFIHRVRSPSPTADHQPIQRILLAVGGGPHSALATESARVLALDTDAQVDVIHGFPESPSDADRGTASELLDAAEGALNEVGGVETFLVETAAIADEIVERSADYDLTILGAPTRGLLKQFVFGSVAETVRQNAPATVLMTKANSPARTSLYDRWLKDDASDKTTATE